MPPLNTRLVVALLATAIVTVCPRVTRAQPTVITFDDVSPICQNFVCSPPPNYPWNGAAFSTTWTFPLVGSSGNVMAVPFGNFGGTSTFASSTPFTLQSVLVGPLQAGTTGVAGIVGRTLAAGTVWQWFGIQSSDPNGETFVNPFANVAVDVLDFYSGSAYYDNLSVEQTSTVPEPSTLALLIVAVALAVIAGMRQVVQRHRDA